VPVQRDEFRLLTAQRSLPLWVPPQLRNHGNLIVSLSQLTPLLAQHAESLGVDVLPGFAAAAPVYGANGRGRRARGRHGPEGRRQSGSDFTAGPEIRATTTVVAGAAGAAAKC
jgi:electron-transferring-flavoprotein dehydrogenase